MPRPSLSVAKAQMGSSRQKGDPIALQEPSMENAVAIDKQKGGKVRTKSLRARFVTSNVQLPVSIPLL